MSIVNDILDAYVSVETAKSEAQIAATQSQQTAALNSTQQASNAQASSASHYDLTAAAQSMPRWGWVALGVAAVGVVVFLAMKK